MDRQGTGATATITCPECRATSREVIPADACLFFYACPACRRVLRPKREDCCVFCSYGDRQCPSSGGADCVVR
ncbi:MAG TPA: GDCCVxC domain-containing (seleno)protein [Vicinamibacterales bacterium]|nr:GDCCVxC domain-containing (seleno)protein [Vicinamibacterales bacterium]